MVEYQGHLTFRNARARIQEISSAIERPDGIDPDRWARAPWHAKRKVIDAQNRAARPQEVVYVDPEPDDALEYLEFSPEVVEEMLERSYSPTYIADHFGLSAGAVEARMRRAGRTDLAAPFSRMRTGGRKKPCLDCDAKVGHGSSRCNSCANRKSRADAEAREGVMTCPVCGQPTTPTNANGKPRKACSAQCAGRLSRLYALDEVTHLTAVGESPAAILRALNTTPTALARRLYRAHRPDLAAPFERLRKAAS